LKNASIFEGEGQQFDIWC